MILLAGAGSFECAHITMTRGLFIGDDAQAGTRLCAELDRLRDRTDEVVPASGWEQYRRELENADASSMPTEPTVPASNLC